MPDNGFGNKLNSYDFLIRAYYLRPDFKTARGGSGEVHVGEFIQFSDPQGLIGFPIYREGVDRLLTGADIDPESLQRGRDGSLWVGDEFGPWILHFDAHGTAAPSAVRAARRPGVAEQPVARRGRRPSPGAGASRGWPSRPTAGT